MSLSLSFPALAWVPLLFAHVLPLPQDTEEMRRGEVHLRAGRWEQAADSFRIATEKSPSNGQAWFQLGLALHSGGDYEEALTAHARSATFPEYRATATYNQACALSLLGRTDDAQVALNEAIPAGFLDFDLMATDTDLAAMRERWTQTPSESPFAPELEYEPFRGRSGRKLAYRVLLPEHFNAEASHPVLIAFPPGGQGARSADWFIEHFWRDALVDTDWIVVVPVVPEEGWLNHPSHHALDDLLRKLSKDFEVEGEFHAFGMGSGARPAGSFSRMSKRFFQSITVVGGRPWGGWSPKELREFRDGPVHQIVGSEDALPLELMQEAHDVFKGHGVEATLTVVAESGPVLEGLRGTDLLAAVARAVAPGSSGGSH